MKLSSRGSAVLALSAALLVSGCQGSGSTAAAGASAAGTTSATAGAAAGGDAATPTAGAPTTVPAATDPATTPAPATAAASASAASAACRNLSVTAAVKSVVLAAFKARNPTLKHVGVAPKTFYYGGCGSTTYAIASFRATAGATDDELVLFQDDGSARKLFVDNGAAGWKYVTSDTFPATPGCVGAVPAALARAWGHCPLGES
jgi:hypothetical protein